MKRNQLATLLSLAILLLLAAMLYLTLPLQNVRGAVIQIIAAIGFAGLVSLTHKIPVKWVHAVRSTPPFDLSSRSRFRLAVLLVGVAATLPLILIFPFNLRSVWPAPFTSKAETTTDSEYLISMLDSFKADSVRMRGAEEMRLEYLDYPDDDFRNTILNRSAFVSFVRGDLQQASEFVASGLKWYPEDKELLAIRGLVAYEQSSYEDALKSFQQAIETESQLRTGKLFQATMLGNEGLVRWELGQADEAEKTLVRSRDLFGEDNSTKEESYVLLNQGKLYADYWQLANASAKNNSALELASRIESNAEARNQQANVSRQRAEIASLRGPLDVARREAEVAINIHRETQGLQYLAQDYEVKAAIQDQAGLDDGALSLLREAANIYKEGGSSKELSENWLKQAKLLLDQERYAEAQKLIRNASEEFYRIGYRRGVGEASALEGELLRQRATSKDLKKDNPQLVIGETRKAFDLYQKAYDIFQEIGYVRGVADANNFLGLAVIQINKPVGGDTTGEALSDGAFQSARHYLEQAAESYRQIGDKRGEANVYGNFGVLYRNHRDYDSAIEWLNKAFQIHEEIGFQLGMARQFINIGRVYCAKSDRDKANEYLGRAKEKLAGIEGGYKERQAVDRSCR
jgi:tetratricopeptide (TPR) repeat protein